MALPNLSTRLLASSSRNSSLEDNVIGMLVNQILQRSRGIAAGYCEDFTDLGVWQVNELLHEGKA